MTMELDDLRRSWMEHDQRLDEALRLNRRRLLASDMGRTRSVMQRVRAGIGFGLVFDVLALVLVGAFIGAHFAEPRFLLPAVVLHLVAVGALVSRVLQWVRASAINYDAPVLDIQRRLEALRVLRIRTTQVVLLLAPLLWTPLLIVGLRALGVDAYAVLGASYLLANLLFGLAFVPVVVWVCRRFADRLDRSPLVQSLARDVAGKSLTAAMDQLARLAAFEREEGGGR